MQKSEPKVVHNASTVLISAVLIVLSLVFLFLSMCGAFIIAFSGSALPEVGGQASALGAGLTLLVVSLAALYVIYRAWGRVRGMGPKQE